MQEIKKRRIVIASVLKPVDDTRMFEKMGKSLAAIANVYIVGYPTKKNLVSSNPHQFGLRPFKRIGLKRLLAPWRILALVWRIKPDLFILTTHELLVVGCVAKVFRGCRLIYDVQENYYRNILYTPAFPKWLRPVIAAYVRCKEKVLRLAIDHYTLAERGYEKELLFLKDRRTVIENKFLPPETGMPLKKSAGDGKVHLLFSGTLAQSTGVFEAVNLTVRLHTVNAAIRLTIIGYCALKEERERLMEEIAPYPFIKLIGGDYLIPHADILQEISTSDFGIISYPPNPATINSVPTKLYEYLGARLPILLSDHSPWADLCAPYDAALVFDLQAFDAALFMKEMVTKTFYTRLPEEVFWKSEAAKLLNIANSFYRYV